MFIISHPSFTSVIHDLNVSDEIHYMKSKINFFVILVISGIMGIYAILNENKMYENIYTYFLAN